MRPSFTSGRLEFRIDALLFKSTRSLIMRIYLPCESSPLPMLTMSTPALNFVAVCGNANLPLNGTKAPYLKALKGPGVALGPSLTPADLKERFGAPTWVRHAVK